MITCPYRIYPAWFGGAAFGPINELAYGAAARMKRQVLDIDITGHGTDGRGQYVDFSVSYSSAFALRVVS